MDSLKKISNNSYQMLIQIYHTHVLYILKKIVKINIIRQNVI